MPEDHPSITASAADSESRSEVSGDDPASGSSSPARPPDVLFHLWFEQFKQINALAVAATAGALILLQMGLVETAPVSGASILAMAAAVLVAMTGQNALIDDAAEGRSPGASVRRARGIAAALLAGGAGAFVSYGYFTP